VDEEPLTEGDLLAQWREATRAAELAERLAGLATQAAEQSDAQARASEQMVRLAEKTAIAAERAAHTARTAARNAADLADRNRHGRLREANDQLVDARANESEARDLYEQSERSTRERDPA
jgi:hypothetical protein